MNRLAWLVCLWLAVASPALLAVPSLQPGQPVPDLRVLVDVSGSMRETDPDRLTHEALGLFAELLPDGSRASVWTFGSDASPMVPLGRVDDRWRAELRRLVDGLHPSERYTDIETALEAVDGDWNWPAEGDSLPAVILLTDGQVDVGTDAENADSRRRILGARVAALRRRGVRVFPIALSAAADVELMQSLALGSGGFLSVAAGPDALLRSFLDIIGGTVPGNGLPYSGSGFEVDPFIDEFTVLLLPGHADARVRLHDPEGRSHRADAHPQSFQWLARPAYQMITVSGPTPGRWLLDAGGTQPARISIITDLLLIAEGLPASAALGEQLSLAARLEMNGEPLADTRLLELLQWRAELIAPDGAVRSVDLAAEADAPQARGLLAGLEQPGVHTIRIIAEMGTLLRERTQLVRVFADLFAVDAQEHAGRHRVRVRPRGDFLDPATVTVLARITSGHMDDRSELGSWSDDGAWYIDVAPQESGQYQVQIDISGQARSGRVFRVQPEPLLLGMPLRVVAEPQAEPPVAPAPPAVAPEPAAGIAGWVWLLAAIVGAAGGLLGWRALRGPGRMQPAPAPAAESDERQAPAESKPGPAATAGPAEEPAEPVQAPEAAADQPAGERRRPGPVGPAYEGRARDREVLPEEPPDEDADKRDGSDIILDDD